MLSRLSLVDHRHVQYTSRFLRQREPHRGIEAHDNERLSSLINLRSSSVHVNTVESSTCKSSAVESMDILQLSLTMSILCMQIRVHIFAYVCVCVCVLETIQSRERRMALSRRKVRSLRFASAKRSICTRMDESSRAKGREHCVFLLIN